MPINEDVAVAINNNLAQNRQLWEWAKPIPELKGQFYHCIFDETAKKFGKSHTHKILEARHVCLPRDIRGGIALMLANVGLVFLGTKSKKHISVDDF